MDAKEKGARFPSLRKIMLRSDHGWLNDRHPDVSVLFVSNERAKGTVLALGGGVRRVPSLDQRPVVAHWELTRSCRPDCLRCRPGDAADADPIPLSHGEVPEVVAQIAAAGTARLVFSGGDHRTRPDLDAIVRDAADRGLEVTVVLCSVPARLAVTCARLADAGARTVALTVDSGTTTPARRVQAVADAARRAGLTVQIDTTVTRATAGDVPALGQLVARLAPALWNVRVAVTPLASPDPEQYETMLHSLCVWSARTGLSVQTTAAPALRRVIFERENDLPRAERLRARRARGVISAPNDGKGIVFLSHSGDVYPSELLPCSAGNIRRTTLAEIYRTAPLFRDIRAYWRLEGKCGACPFYVSCGGSRARAYAASGRLLAEDPSCEYQPMGYARRMPESSAS
jgi:radical SAM protein with 4Fe4S-binding SPASM domain